MQHQYADLGRKFALPTLPEKIQKPEILLWNLPLAEELGLKLNPPEQAQYFTGQQLFEGSKPVAMAYAGHQFGHFNPQLGDGRAHLLGELENAEGQIKELHLKGSGRTPFSRNGDGKCAIKPAVREYIMSEALFALGVPTTRTLAVVITNQELFRQQPTTGAVVTRVASSHIRVGTFEYFAARGLHTELKQLVDLTISRHYPHIDLNNTSKYINLLSHVIDKHIELVVNWMRVGFIHGVMNTDNTLLSGETIDYGPCAMLGSYNPATVFSSIDDQGRYAFANQPNITHWNLARLAECLIPLMGDNQQKAIDVIMPVLNDFSPKFKSAYNLMMANKLGMKDASKQSIELSDNLLELMKRHQLDYTQTFNLLTQIIDTSDLNKVESHSEFNDWLLKWQAALSDLNQSIQETKQLLQQQNPVVIPRNHHIEAVLSDVENDSKNTARLDDFLKVLQSPYQHIDNTFKYQDANADYDLTYQTFCGT